MKNLILLIGFIALGSSSFAQFTNNEIDKILKNNIDTLQGENGYWEFIYDDVMMICMTDERANRLRIFSPIIHTDSIAQDQLVEMLEANFDKSLDVRYCIYDDVIISAFIHPLAELVEWQFIDGILQVRNAVSTFGDEYSSGAIHLNTPENQRSKKARKL